VRFVPSANASWQEPEVVAAARLVICVAAAGVALVLVEEVKLLVYDLCRVKANQAVLWPGLITAGCWSPARAADRQ
jgi:hypothetical protein